MSSEVPPDCLFYLKSIQGGAIRTLFEVLKEIVHDVSLEVDETGVRLATMDGAKCAAVYMKLRADGFEEFYCKQECEVGINVSCFFKLVRSTGSHDTVTLYSLASNIDELGITIENAEKNSKTDFRLKLLDVDSEPFQFPDIEFHSVITMPSQYLQRLCRDAYNIADNMVICSRGKALALKCSGDFARQETVIGETDEGVNIRFVKGWVEGTFPLKYLSLFCKSSSLCNTVELLLREDFPLIMKYKVASLGEIKYMLAPSSPEE